MTNPISKYLKNLFAFNRVLNEDVNLRGLVKADVILQGLVDDKKVPGIAITALREGKMVLQKGYGCSNLEDKIPIDPVNTIFRIASVSKPIAATALAHMVAEGLIDLDASFYKYVSYYPKKKWDFTIRQLASHTAGIRGYQGKEYGLNKPYSIKDSIEIFSDDDLLFEPGTAFLYNSFDWVLISLAMQEVSGIPFEVYVNEKVLEPLGMGNTFMPLPSSNLNEVDNEINTLTVPTEQIANLASFYSKNKFGFRKSIRVNNFYKLAGGGYLSNTSDIAKFGQAILNKEALNKKVIDQFLTSEIINGEPTYYGLGWQISEDSSGRPFYGHVGNGVGGYANFFVYPKEKTVIAILINCTDPKVQESLDVVVDALVAENILV